MIINLVKFLFCNKLNLNIVALVDFGHKVKLIILSVDKKEAECIYACAL